MHHQVLPPPHKIYTCNFKNWWSGLIFITLVFELAKQTPVGLTATNISFGNLRSASCYSWQARHGGENCNSFKSLTVMVFLRKFSLYYWCYLYLVNSIRKAKWFSITNEYPGEDRWIHYTKPIYFVKNWNKDLWYWMHDNMWVSKI